MPACRGTAARYGPWLVAQLRRRRISAPLFVTAGRLVASTGLTVTEVEVAGHPTRPICRSARSVAPVALCANLRAERQVTRYAAPMAAFYGASDHTVLADVLGSRVCVVDLGGNHGAFSRRMQARFPVGDYHVVEANPGLIAELEAGGFTSVSNLAISGAPGSIRFHVCNDDTSSSVIAPAPERCISTVEVEAATIGAVLRATCPEGIVDVVKLDIEGAEIAALRALALESADLMRIGQLSVEFHDADMFGFYATSETKQVMRLLRRQGFVALDLARSHLDVLFVNLAIHRPRIWTRVGWHMFAARRRWAIILRTFLGRQRRRTWPR